MSFNAAPVDSEEYMGVVYANACEVTEVAGVGLARFGYYPCAVAAGIDRVFGLDIGRRSLPQRVIV